MNFESFKNKVLQALEQIGLDIKSKANASEVDVIPTKIEIPVEDLPSPDRAGVIEYLNAFGGNKTKKQFYIVEIIGELQGPSEPTNPSSDEFLLNIVSPVEGATYTEGTNIPISADLTPVSSGVNPFVIEETDYLHLITYGQSNSTGDQTNPVLSNDNVGGNLMIGSHHLIDSDTEQPSDFSLLQFDGSDTDIDEGMVMPWTNALKTKAATKLPSSHINTAELIATTAGSGGRTVTQLTNDDYWKFNRTRTWAKNIADSKGKTISCPAIMYCQGETENLTAKADYKAALLNLLETMRNDIQTSYGQINKPVIILAQPKDPASEEINMAIYELINEQDWIVGSHNLYYLPSQPTGYHLESNGARIFGETLAKVMIDSLSTGNKYEPLKPVSFNKTGTKVEVTFNKNLINDQVTRGTGATGLSIQGMSGISVSVSGNKAIIETGVDTASYGDMTVQYRNGRLRSDDNYQATTLYEDYTFVGSQGTANNFIDSNGDIIYGQSYPLWDWAIEFTITI